MSNALLKPTVTNELVNLKAKISVKHHDKMNAYMAWAGFESEGDFISQCIDFVVNSDKNFKKMNQEN